MSFHRNAAVVLCLSALATGCSGGGGGTPVSQATAAPTATPTAGPAVTITNSASTNTKAYTVVLQTNASATVSQDGYTGATTISTSDAAKFFADLNANVPVSNVVTEEGCLKSASFGTTTELTYEGSHSGDISCPPSSTSPAETLYQDEQNVVADMQAKLGGFNH